MFSRYSVLRIAGRCDYLPNLSCIEILTKRMLFTLRQSCFDGADGSARNVSAVRSLEVVTLGRRELVGSGAMRALVVLRLFKLGRLLKIFKFVRSA